MAFAVQRSLFDADGGSPMSDSGHWIEGVVLGELTVGVCVLALALMGALMLTGRLPLREGARIVVGCFVMVGAPVIASAFVVVGGNAISIEPPPPPSDNGSKATSRPPLRPADYDPYAGASLNQN